MQAELDRWHEHQSYFINTGLREDFNIPKFHSLIHYLDSICWLGTTDNYNTEMFERLHIDFTKEGWRASNKHDHFPQMVKWLSRQEKIASYDFYRSWLDDFDQLEAAEERTGEEDDEITISASRRLSLIEGQFYLAKHPAEPQKSLARILISHAAPGFLAQLKLFSSLPSSFSPAGFQVPSISGHHSIYFSGHLASI